MPGEQSLELKPRRMARVAVDPYWVGEWLKNSATSPCAAVGVPQSARMIRWYVDQGRWGDKVYLVFEHETFPEVPVGGVVPVISVEIYTDEGIKCPYCNGTGKLIT